MLMILDLVILERPPSERDHATSAKEVHKNTGVTGSIADHSYVTILYSIATLIYMAAEYAVCRDDGVQEMSGIPARWQDS
jgi:hypothetical protein